MENERGATIKIGGEDYELLFTTRAAKDIANRYEGGLEGLGETLEKTENVGMALEEVVWIIAILANQTIMIHNLKNKDDKRPLITEEEVELLTSPYDLKDCKSAIAEAIKKGTARNVLSESEEEESKNV